jgi:hypothetical protein
MLLLLLPVIVVAAVVALAIDVPGRQVARWSAIAVAAVVALGVVEAVLVLGLRGGDDDEDTQVDVAQVAEQAEPEAVQVAEQEAEPSTTTTSTAVAPGGVRRADAVLVEPDPDAAFPAPVRPVDELEDGDLLLLEAALERDGELRQCPQGTVRSTDCGTAVPVPAPLDGVAQFLAPVAENLVSGRGEIDCSTQTCALVLFDAGDDGVVASLPLVFGHAATAPTIELSRDGPFEDGDAVGVRLAEFPPGEEIVITQCTPPGPADSSRCGAPAPEVAAVIGPEGEVAVQFRIHLGPVGAARDECRRAEPCAIAVLDTSVAAAPVAISLAGTPSSDVPDRRVLLGLGAAAVLVGVAVLLILRGDWKDPDGDPFDDVELTVPEGWEDLRAEVEAAEFPRD